MSPERLIYLIILIVVVIVVLILLLRLVDDADAYMGLINGGLR